MEERTTRLVYFSTSQLKNVRDSNGLWSQFDVLWGGGGSN